MCSLCFHLSETPLTILWFLVFLNHSVSDMSLEKSILLSLYEPAWKSFCIIKLNPFTVVNKMNMIAFNSFRLSYAIFVQSCPTLQPHELQCSRLPWPSLCPWSLLIFKSVESLMLSNLLILSGNNYYIHFVPLHNVCYVLFFRKRFLNLMFRKAGISVLVVIFVLLPLFNAFSPVFFFFKFTICIIHFQWHLLSFTCCLNHN